jgi:hypothetical protein
MLYRTRCRQFPLAICQRGQVQDAFTGTSVGGLTTPYDCINVSCFIDECRLLVFSNCVATFHSTYSIANARVEVEWSHAAGSNGVVHDDGRHP